MTFRSSLPGSPTPGCTECSGDFAAEDVAGEGDPLLGEDPNDHVQRTAEGGGSRGFQTMAAPLQNHDKAHRREAGQGGPAMQPRSQRNGRAAGDEERRRQEVNDQVSPITVCVAIASPLPREKSSGVGVVHAFQRRAYAPSALEATGRLVHAP